MYLNIQNNPYGDNKKDPLFEFHILYFNFVSIFLVIKNNINITYETIINNHLLLIHFRSNITNKTQDFHCNLSIWFFILNIIFNVIL